MDLRKFFILAKLLGLLNQKEGLSLTRNANYYKAYYLLASRKTPVFLENYLNYSRSDVFFFLSKRQFQLKYLSTATTRHPQALNNIYNALYLYTFNSFFLSLMANKNLNIILLDRNYLVLSSYLRNFQVNSIDNLCKIFASRGKNKVLLYYNMYDTN